MSAIDFLIEKEDRQRQASIQPRLDATNVVTTLLTCTLVLFFILPFAGLVWRAIGLPPSSAVAFTQVLDALGLSLATTAASMVLIVLFGTPTAFVLARYQFPLKRLLSVFIEIPIVMPPVVAGLALLSAFGRRGLLGGVLQVFGLQLPFTTLAVIMAQVFVAAPFYIRAAQSRFSTVPPELEEAARIDGAGSWLTFSNVTLPLSLNALLTGLTLSWARALGEFGATILFAGNLQGTTQTMPLLVYSAMERDLGSTFTTALILLGIAAVLLGVMRWFARMDVDDTRC
jgi:molybdate transport system permease protein